MLSLVGFILARAEIWDARAAMTWLVGSVGNAGSTELRVLCVVVLAVLPLAQLADRPLRVLELGDDQATTLGGSVELDRLLLVAVGVVLVAFATAAARADPLRGPHGRADRARDWRDRHPAASSPPASWAPRWCWPLTSSPTT